MKKLLYIVSLLWIAVVILVSCDKLGPAAPEEDSLLDGPVEGLTPTQNNLFLKGDIAFNDEVFTPVTGLAPNSQGGKYFLLHDGRARSIEEAIQYHGGEAENSKNLYNSLTENEKKQLIQFLESL